MAQSNAAEKVTFQATTLRDDRGFTRALQDAKQGVDDGFMMIQDCILYGLEKYQKNSADASYLSRAMDICIGIPGMNPNAVKNYIVEHANVVYRQAPDSTKKFGKVGKGPASVIMPEEGYFWFDHVASRIIVRADMIDPVAELIKLVQRIEKKEKDGKLPESRKDMFHELEAALEPYLKMEPLPKEQLFSNVEATGDEGDNEGDDK